ncbi:MAG: fatty acyl-AMP ligase [Solirubrobacteraceae bacterium]|nr:fatty acyl-AMP ligase [Solirubrobacteraceae bacterium]
MQESREAPPLETLGDVAFLASYLDHWGRHTPTTVAATYIDYATDRHGLERSVSYGELDGWTRALAAKISQVTQPGDRVALLASQSLEYGAGFLATLRSHAMSVPLFAPDLPGQGDRLNAVVADCAPTAVLVNRDKLDLVKPFCAAHGISVDRILVIDDYRADQDSLVAAYAFPSSIQLDDVAYLQYTSGSTRAPVGVCLTHRNMVENALQLRDGYDIHFSSASTVSWLPLFHDMGLILGVAAPVVGGLHSVVLDPVAFVLKPLRWLQAISGRTNVMTAAPNFAFDYAVKRVKPEDRKDLDLSGVIAWINGAEPVLPATLERFAESFAPQGVTELAVKPTYGLAEATVFVATPPLHEPATIIEVDSEQLQHGVVTTDVRGEMRPTKLVSCGRAIGQHLAIVDPETCELLPDGRVGEIWLNGPNIGVGYWNKPDDSEALFNARLQGGGDLPTDRWLRTEDLGVVLDGRFYVTGRIKDLIIIDGRNVYPHDVEFTVEESHDAIAQRRLAAFSVPTEAGEALVVVAERYRHHADAGAQLADVAAAARQAVTREHAVALHDFVLVEPDTIPRTSSGKIARKASRTGYLAGTLQRTPAA